jgi:ATP-dependent DNA ligase
MNNFPPLIKKFKNKTRFWEIILKGATVYTKTGYIDGKIRETEPTKFIATKNNTALQNALSFAKRKWIEKTRQGYKPLQSKNSKIINKNKKQVKNFVHPMRAVLLEGNEHKLRFPVYVQAKLDGFRGIVRKDDNIKILSINGLPYKHLDVIKKQLSSFPLLNKNTFLDGEIYLHDRPISELRRVMGRKFIESLEMKEIENKIRFVIFDWYDLTDVNRPFSHRWEQLEKAYFNWKPLHSRVELDYTVIVKNRKDMLKERDLLLKKGYEGIVVRNKDGIYLPGKRSVDVFRSKEFKKNIFKIVDAIEGKGENKGTVIWKLECLGDKNKYFYSKPMGTREERREWYKNKDRYIGKKLEVKYMEIGDNGCVTRFPVGIKIIN